MFMPRLFLLLAFATTMVSASDLKITTVTHTDSGSMPAINGDTRTEYVHGPMRRQEFRSFVGESPRRPNRQAPQMAIISNCDTRESFTLDLDAGEYLTGQLPEYPSEQDMRARGAKGKARSRADRPSPNLRIESNTVDTGERAEFFGRPARHYVTTVKRTPLGDLATHGGASEEIEDAWYIDLQVPSSNCMPQYFEGRGAVAILVAGDPDSIQPEVKRTGPVPEGLIVKMKRTTTSSSPGRNAERASTFETQVTELSEEPLDPALFQVPPGFKKVEHLYRH